MTRGQSSDWAGPAPGGWAGPTGPGRRGRSGPAGVLPLRWPRRLWCPVREASLQVAGRTRASRRAAGFGGSPGVSGPPGAWGWGAVLSWPASRSLVSAGLQAPRGGGRGLSLVFALPAAPVKESQDTWASAGNQNSSQVTPEPWSYSRLVVVHWLLSHH